MVDRRARRIKRLGMGVSVVALASAGQAMAQTQPPCEPNPIGYCVITNDGTTGTVTLPSPARLINRGTISGNEGVVFNGIGTIPLNEPTPAMAIVDNRAGATITGTGGTAIRANGALTVINGGTINGNVTGAFLYVANGGTLNGNLTLGTGNANDFGGQFFIQRGATTGVTGTITAGNGIDFWVRSFASSTDMTLGTPLPATFEVEGVESIGRDTLVNVFAPSATPVRGLMLAGDGQIINNANVTGMNTVGAGFPANTVVFAPAISYYGVPETSGSIQFRFPSQTAPGQFVGYSVPVLGALTNFTNRGTVTGDIRLSTSHFTNYGTINLQTRATGTLILTAKDQDFHFGNAGFINYVDTGARAGQAAIEQQYLYDDNATAALRIYQVLADVAKNVSIENGGQITGGIAAHLLARNFVFTNTNSIAGIESANAEARGFRLVLGTTILDDGEEEVVVADRASFMNDVPASITHGISIDGYANTLIFENRGTISGSANNPNAINIDQYGVENADGTQAPSASFSFVNSGTVRGDTILNVNSLRTSVTNSGSMTMAARNIGFQPFSTGFETLEIGVDIYGASTIDFVNSGSIIQNNRGATAVSFEVDATAGSTLNIVNSGEIRADAGATRTNGQFVGQPAGTAIFVPSVGMYVGVEAPQANVRIENRQGGLISAYGLLYAQTPTGSTVASTVPGFGSIALLLNTGAGSNVEIVNAGTIQGGPLGVFGSATTRYDVEWQIEENRFGGAITGGAGNDTLINTATGLIRGGIALGAGNDRVENYGQILGAVHLGTGNDTYLHLLKNQNFGTVDGGAGEDTLIFDITGSDGVVSDSLLAGFLNFEIRKLTGTGNVITNNEVKVEDGGDLNLGAGSVITTPGQTAVGGGDGSENVSNAGTIIGNIALGGGNNAFTNSGNVTGDFTSGSGGDNVANAGTFTGNVSTGDGGDEFTNTGTFTGNVDLRLGSDKYVIGNAVRGTVNGGEGIDEAVFNLGSRTMPPPAQPAASGGLPAARAALGAAREALIGGLANGAATVSLDGTPGPFDGSADALDLGAFPMLDTPFADVVAQAAGDPILLTPAIVGDIVGFELLSVNGPGTVDASGNFTVGTIVLNGADLIVRAGNTLSTTGPATINGSAGSETVTVAGTVTGGIALGGGVDTLNVTGRIGGAVDLGDGTDTLNIGSGASFGGTVSGGAGVDTINVNTNGTAAAPYVIAGGSFTGFENFVNAGGATAITGALNLGANGLFSVNGGSLMARVGAVLTGNIAVATGGSFGNAGTVNGSIAFDNGGHSFTNSGTVTGSVASGSGNDTVTNSGVIQGNVALGAGSDTLNANGRFGGTIDLGDGNDTLNIGVGALFTGSVVGGAGTDGIVVAAGGTEASPFELIGNFGGFESYNQAGGVTAVTGIINLGATGSFNLTGGRLFGRAQSTLTGNVAVASGAAFGSAGTVNGNITVASGGTLAPGASPGIMTVNGNVSLAGGSSTVFEFVPAPGQSDQLNINGSLTIASGAVLNMTGNRPLTPGVTYNMITATGGITGTFTTVNKAATVLGFLRYTATQLQLLGTFQVPTDASIQTGAAINYFNSVLIAGQANQALINAIPSLLNSNGTANLALFDQLTPEAYATASQLSVEQGLTLSKTFRNGISAPSGTENRPFIFGQGMGNWRDLDGNGALGTSSASMETYGFVAGVGYGSEAASIGVFAGKLDSKQTIRGLGARTDADGVVAGFVARLASGGLDVTLLAAYDGSEADTSRAVPGGSARSRYDLNSLVLDMSAGYSLPVGGDWAIRPEVGVTRIATDRDQAIEAGSATFGYTIAPGDRNATFIDGALTLKGGLDPASTIKPWVQVGVRHQLEGDYLTATGGFAGTTGFTVFGSHRQETLATAGAGISAELGNGVSIGAAYQGEFGARKSHNATVGLRFGF